MQFCLKKLNSLYKLSQRIELSMASEKQTSTANQTSTAASNTATSVSVKLEKEDGVTVKAEKVDELDSVFSPAVEDVAMAAGHQADSSNQQRSDGTKNATPGDEAAASSTGNHRNKSGVTIDQSGEPTMVTMETTDQKQLAKKHELVSLFSWCEHHQRLVGLLSCVVQTVALSCTTALVHLPLADPSSKPSVAREEKDYSLLKNLQFSISDLPIPSGLSDSRKKQQVDSVVFVCMPPPTQLHTCTRTCKHAHTHTHTHTHKSHIHTHSIHIQTYIHTDKCTYTYT